MKMVILRGKAWSFWEAWLVFGFSNKIIVKFLFPIATVRGILFINNTSYYCRMQLSSLYSKILIKSLTTSLFLFKILVQNFKFNLRAAIFLDFRLQEVLIWLLAITVTRKRVVNGVKDGVKTTQTLWSFWEAGHFERHPPVSIQFRINKFITASCTTIFHNYRHYVISIHLQIKVWLWIVRLFNISIQDQAKIKITKN